MTYKILNKEQVIAYVESQANLLPGKGELFCEEMNDGNVNNVFRVINAKTKISLIVKQSLEYAKCLNHEHELSLDRFRLEGEVMRRMSHIRPEAAPRVLHQNNELSILVMEDLHDYKMLRACLIRQKQYPRLAEQMGRYMASLHFYHSDFYFNVKQKQADIELLHYSVDLKQLQDQLSFVDPYYDATSNHIPNELKAYVQHVIWQDKDLLDKVADLRKKFLTEQETLIHADLHSGNVVVSKQACKWVDFELSGYGPAGADLGVFLGNLMMNCIAQPDLCDDQEKVITMQAYLEHCIIGVWQAYYATWQLLVEERARKSHHLVLDDFLQKVFDDAMGFAGIELIHRAIGASPVSDIKRIKDHERRVSVRRELLERGVEMIRTGCCQWLTLD